MGPFTWTNSNKTRARQSRSRTKKTVRLRVFANEIASQSAKFEQEIPLKPSESFATSPIDSVGHTSGRRHENYHKHQRRRKTPLMERALSSVLLLLSLFALVIAGVESEFLSAQPLVYLHDAGSGDGYPRPVLQFRDSSSSSSMTPSLIAAKCWNNFEGDNDCKHLNVITGPSGSSSQPPNSEEDDSLITPVVIFESSSSYEPDNNNNNNYPTGADSSTDQAQQITPSYPYPSQQAAPSPSSGSNNNNNNVLLARHRTPPASREEIFTTTTTTTTTTDLSDRFTGSSDGQLRPTQPTTSVYVATPQPRGQAAEKAHKTTTEGRKCRDDNDDDCDEPENNNNNSIKPEDGANDNGDADDDSGEADADDTESSSKRLDAGLESGSGEAPTDDNDDTDDDDPDDGSEAGPGFDESSGNSDSGSNLSSSPRYIEVGSTIATTATPTATTTADSEQPSTTRQGAQIEVVVHPTLPPSFPTTTTTTTTTSTSANEATSEQDSLGSTPSTLMPDDTFKSKPVYPSTSEPSNEIDLPAYGVQNRNNPFNGDLSNNIGDGHDGATSEPPIDLATFKPIPMMPQVEQPIRSNLSVSSMSTSVAAASGQSSAGSDNKLADRYKFEPGAQTPAPAFKFDNAWRAQPVRAPTFQSNAGSPSDSWQAQQQRELQQRQRAKFAGESPSPAVSSQMSAPGSGAAAHLDRSRLDSAEMLPTLLLYASICILVVLALIFVIMAAAIWRQKNARQRALLHKSQLLGAASGQLVSSMSHASQLMVNNNNLAQFGHQQQPGLLTTYGPGKGLQLQNKITTSLVRESADNLDSADNLRSDVDVGSLNGANKNLSEQPGSNRNATIQRDRPAAAAGYPTTSSWSTDDQTTSSSAGSQGRDQNHQLQQQQQQGYQQQAPAASRQTQFNSNNNNNNNSLSDGRQNSSSISDSQESPDGTIISAGQQAHQGESYAINPRDQSSAMYPIQPQPHGDQMQGYPPPAQQMLYNQPGQLGNNSQTPIKGPPFHPGQSMALSQSEESFQHQQQGINPGSSPMMRLPPPHLEGGYATTHNGPRPGIPKGPSQVVSMRGPANNVYVGPAPNGFNQPAFSGGMQPVPHPESRTPNGRASVDYALFDGPPINQARVAMNPLATMSRRPVASYQHHPGLNRNIYSEDSSSLMTASPSLARTSSSSSFAFNNHQLSLDRAIEAKPMIDPATGRLFNDYSHINQNSATTEMPTNGGPPPIVGRKNPGEAWYV